MVVQFSPSSYKLMHECCRSCEKLCKHPKTDWSGCMPCTEYCEHYTPKKRKQKVKKE